jgi:hypothetical protein
MPPISQETRDVLANPLSDKIDQSPNGDATLTRQDVEDARRELSLSNPTVSQELTDFLKEWENNTRHGVPNAYDVMDIALGKKEPSPQITRAEESQRTAEPEGSLSDLAQERERIIRREGGVLTPAYSGANLYSEDTQKLGDTIYDITINRGIEFPKNLSQKTKGEDPIVFEMLESGELKFGSVNDPRRYTLEFDPLGVDGFKYFVNIEATSYSGLSDDHIQRINEMTQTLSSALETGNFEYNPDGIRL